MFLGRPLIDHEIEEIFGDGNISEIDDIDVEDEVHPFSLLDWLESDVPENAVNEPEPAPTLVVTPDYANLKRRKELIGLPPPLKKTRSQTKVAPFANHIGLLPPLSQSHRLTLNNQLHRMHILHLLLEPVELVTPIVCLNHGSKYHFKTSLMNTYHVPRER